MLCALDGAPEIVRLHGRGEALFPGNAGYELLRPQFPDHPGVRAIIRITVERVSSSCGYAVPRYAFAERRDTLMRWAEKKGPDGLAAYRRDKNAFSIDGLPAITAPDALEST
jgi:hypothetical protein